jgi:hypothetical protein
MQSILQYDHITTTIWAYDAAHQPYYFRLFGIQTSVTGSET